MRSSTPIRISPGASSSPTSPPIRGASNPPPGSTRLTEEERDRFLELNDAYRQKFGFPFIMAVKGRSKDEILAAFEERLDHEPDQEFETALVQIERIALLRLKDRLPSLADVFSRLA